MAEDHFDDVRELIDRIQKAEPRFCGLHHYDGQIKNGDPSAKTVAREGFSRLAELIAYLKRSELRCRK